MQRKPLPHQILGLLAWLAIAFCAGGIGAIASVDAPSFYAQLDQPSWAPPAAVFGPVWSTLYALMGIAAWLVWRAAVRANAALAVFLLQLAVNALWSWLFFAWHEGALAFIDTIVLVALIVATVALFFRVSKAAALLMLPYLGWVSFAAVLTWTVWQKNPAFLG